MRPLEGKIALVTGGSRGIGRAISLKLAAEGASIIINHFRRKSTAEATAEEIKKLGVDAHIIKANVGEPEEIDKMFAEIAEKYGRLDIFISNAASGVARPAMELDAKGWDWTININSRAFLLCAQKAAGLMKAGGRMVTISSLGSQLVLPSYTSVGVSKAALEAVTRYLAIELAPRGIQVNAVSAGAVESEALKMFTADPSLPKPAWQSTPAGRMVLAEDIANVVAFLCREESKMIVGQVIIIDGGVTISPFTAGNAADSQKPC